MEIELDTYNEPLLASSTFNQNSSSSPAVLPQNMRKDFENLIHYFSEYQPKYICTPFKGTCLQQTKTKEEFIFGSREGRIAKCNIEQKQLTLDKNLEEGSIWTIDISSNNQFLYSGGQSGKIKKLSLSTLEEEDTLEGHSNEVNCVILSKDDKFLYSCSDDQTVRKWDLLNQTGKVLYYHSQNVYGLDLSQDNVHVASCSSDHTVKVYNNIENQIVFDETIKNSVLWCVRISAKNSFLIAGDDKALIYVWNFGNWNLLRTLSGHLSRVRCLEISKDEKYFVSGGIDNLIKVWDLESWRDEVTIYGHTDWVKAIIISEDFKYIHTMSDDCRIMTSKVPNFDNHKNYPTSSSINKLVYNKREKHVYGSSNHKLLLMKNLKIHQTLQDFNKDILAWNITCNGTRLAAFLVQEKSTETEVVVIDLFGYRNSKSITLKTSSIVSFALATQDGKYFVTGEAFRVTVWDLESGQLVHIFRSHSADVTALATETEKSPENQSLIHLFAGDRNGVIKYYFLSEKFSEIGSFSEENQKEISILRVVFAKKLLFSVTTANKIHIWSIESKSILTEISTNEVVKQVYITDNNLHLFINYANVIAIWNLENYSKCAELILGNNNKDFEVINEETEILISFDGHIKQLENPLRTNQLSLYGNHKNTHSFLAYITKIMNSEVPKHDSSMDNWLIEPYHINPLHLYAYFNLHKHLSKSIKLGGCFFPSKAGYTPLTISIEKKFGECIDSIFENIKIRAERSPLEFYYFSTSLPALNRSSYPKLHQLYETAFSRSFLTTLPKFCDDSVRLPIIKQTKDLIVTHERFMNIEKYSSEYVAIEFVQSYFKVHTKLGSFESLEFVKSLIECKNLEVYTTGLIKIILEQKWKTIKWIFVGETLLYLIYLVFICRYTVIDSEDRENNVLVVPFVINVILFVNEIIQMIEAKLLYFKSFWNYVDISRFMIFSLYCLVELLDFHEEKQENVLLVAVVLSLIRGLSYFRIHSTTRWVINLIFDVFYQLWALILVSTYSVLALGVVYRSLMNDEDFKQAFSINDYDNFKLQWIMFFFVLILNPIIILNLFITIVGDAFDKNQNEKTVKDRQELAEMVFEGELLFFWNRKVVNPKFLHVVREEHVEIQASNTPGQRIKKISEAIELLNRVAYRNKNEIGEIKLFVEGKIEEIQNKTEAILAAVNNKA